MADRQAAGVVPSETTVAIAGAGPVGLALAVELGLSGIDCLVIEPRRRDRLVPRAKLANIRTMEHMRRWGLAEAIRQSTPLPASYSTDIAFVTSVLGREITRFSNVFYTQRARDERFAEPAQQVPQYVLEPVLRRRAEELPSVRFLDGWRVTGLTQDALGVDVEVAGGLGGGAAVVRGDYLVGCDGAGSTVREQLGIDLNGQRSIARNYGVVFRSAELGRLLPFASALHFWTVNAQTPSYMGPGDRTDLWWLQATALDPSVDMATLDPVAVVHGAIGRAVDLEVVNVDPWEAHALTAERVLDGRVMLAGDAAHMHSPMGAHGMNLGIGDAVDLGWKLGAVLDGWADPALLESYPLERGPLHQRMTDEATRNYGYLANHFVRPGLDADDDEGDRLRAQLAEQIRAAKRPEFYSLGLVLGQVYERSPVVAGAEEQGDGDDVDHLATGARVGARAPHGWLRDHTSLFDRFGRGLTLLRTSPGEGSAFQRAARERGIPLTVVEVDDDRVREAYRGGSALVRPDQVVAWAGEDEPRDASALLDVVTGRSVSASSLHAAP